MKTEKNIDIKKKLTIAGLIIAAAVVAAQGTSCITGSGCMYSKLAKYGSAQKMLSGGNYDSAGKAFDALGGYLDSETYSLECSYRKACGLLDDGSSETAAEIFKKLGDYKDSDSLYSSAMLSYARELYEAGSFGGAVSALDGIDGSEAEALRSSALYDDAVQKYENGYYKDAEKEFSSLGDYKNCAAYISLCHFGNALDEAERFGSFGQYSEADEALFDDLLQYKDFEPCREALSSDYFTMMKLCLAKGNWTSGSMKFKVYLDNYTVSVFGKDQKVKGYYIDLVNFWGKKTGSFYWQFEHSDEVGKITESSNGRKYSDYIDFVKFDDPCAKYPKSVTMRNPENGKTYTFKSPHK